MGIKEVAVASLYPSLLPEQISAGLLLIYQPGQVSDFLVSIVQQSYSGCEIFVLLQNIPTFLK